MGLIVGPNSFISWWVFAVPKRLYLWGMRVVGMVGDTFAVKQMATHIGEPIFQDPTWQGRLIGIFIRFFRLIVGLLLEGVFFVLVCAVVIGWYLLPFLAVYEVIR
ncbi:MAG: hypothetical protein WC773_03890 [Patescibacteria group bacterium]|jgi:hypothetical protein